MALDPTEMLIGLAAQTGTVGALVKWLLTRAVQQLDDSLKSLQTDVKALETDLKALDNTDRDQAKALLELKIQNAYLLEQIRQNKDELERVKEQHGEFGGFLASIGFKRSSGTAPTRPTEGT